MFKNALLSEESHWRLLDKLLDNMIRGFMKEYRNSLEEMSEPIMLSQIENTMDLRGLMQYAKAKGVKVSQLTESERLQHSHVKSRISL